MVKKWKTDFSELHDKTRNAFRVPSFNFPLNKNFALLLAVIIVVGGLSYFGVYKPGKYTAILKQNTTELQTQLDECNSNYQSCSDDLATSKTSLIEKSTALSECSSDLTSCNRIKEDCKDALTDCQNDLDDCGDYEDCKDDLDDCKDDLDEFRDILSLSQARDFDDFIHNKNVNDFFNFIDEDHVSVYDLNDLIDGWEGLQEDYAESYCCCVEGTYNATTHMTYYEFSGNPAINLDCYD